MLEKPAAFLVLFFLLAFVYRPSLGVDIDNDVNLANLQAIVQNVLKANIRLEAKVDSLIIENENLQRRQKKQDDNHEERLAKLEEMVKVLSLRTCDEYSRLKKIQ